jgi:hypothetical protein
LATLINSYTGAIDMADMVKRLDSLEAQIKGGPRSMSQARFRQIARLKELAQPYLKRRRQIEKEWRWTLQGAAAHAAILAFLIRYGNPTIDEPLCCACQRVRESNAWKELCEKFPLTLLNWKREHSFESHETAHR